jgi:membrane protein
MGAVRPILLDAVKSFYRNEALALSSAIAYCSLLSMAPLLIVVIGVAGILFTDRVVQEQLIEQFRALIGEPGAELATTVLANTEGERSSTVSLVVGTALTLFGATTVFAQLQTALNRVWRVEAKPGNALWNFVRHRLLSFALVVSLGFLLMISLAASAVLAAVHEYVDSAAFGIKVLMEVLNIAVSFGLATFLIALMFKYLPDAEIDWRDTWLGAFLTALLFIVGKAAIGLYLGRATVASAFGAAGSVVIFMVWVYYASSIILFGAEITHAVAARHGGVAPSPHARPVDEGSTSAA